MKFGKRWRGRTAKDVSEAMSKLATLKARGMTKEERSAHAYVMIKGKMKIVV